MAYDLYPAVDETFNFAPEVRQALSKSNELRNTVVPMTTAVRNNLAPAERWDGRVIANTTSHKVERYDTVLGQWSPLADHSELADVSEDTDDAIAAAIAQGEAALAQAVPIGVILPWAGTTQPLRYLLCDGSAVSRTTFGALYSVCGSTYGGGDGSTTFNIPNLKGRVPVGYDAAQAEFNALGGLRGSKTHNMTESELALHEHPGSQRAVNVSAGSGHTALALYGTGSPNGWETGTAGGGVPFSILQPSITLQYIIKAT